MSVIAWRGKDVNLVTVGKSKLYDYTTVQSALDAIETAGDAALTNEYLIAVGRGYWTNADAQIAHNVSHVHIAAEQRGAAVFLIDDTTYAGGVLVIASDATTTSNTRFVENVIIDGLHLVNNLSGVSKSGGNPPEGALYVGTEAVHPTSGTVMPWNNITISNCICDGVHDALQLFGMGAAGTPGLCVVQNNLLRSNHDAYTIKGGMQVQSAGNVIQSFSSASALPRLTNAADWKTTGIHFNTGAGYFDDTCFAQFSGDNVYVRAEGNIGGATQDLVAGILQYSDGGSYPMRFCGGVILVEFDEDYAPSGSVSGVRIEDTVETDPTLAVINGTIIKVHQRNTGSSAPDTVAGVHVIPDAGAGSPCDPVTVTHCYLDVQNDKGSSNAYSLYAENNTQTIQLTQGSNYSAQATAGTINTLTALS